MPGSPRSPRGPSRPVSAGCSTDTPTRCLDRKETKQMGVTPSTRRLSRLQVCSIREATRRMSRPAHRAGVEAAETDNTRPGPVESLIAKTGLDLQPQMSLAYRYGFASDGLRPKPTRRTPDLNRKESVSHDRPPHIMVTVGAHPCPYRRRAWLRLGTKQKVFHCQLSQSSPSCRRRSNAV